MWKTKAEAKGEPPHLPAGCDEWKVGEVFLKTGKSKGKYEHWLNILHNDASLNTIDSKNDVLVERERVKDMRISCNGQKCVSVR